MDARIQAGMPKLPNLPHWGRRGPSADLVQEQYVLTRQEELEANRMPGRYKALGILNDMLRAKLTSQQKQQGVPFKELLRVYEAIERNLETAELTVNFNCETWFSQANPYDTYTQMYQRAIERNRMVLRDTPLNQADVRADTDNEITFPRSWQQGAQAPLQRGLKPGRQSPDRIQKQMDTGAMVPIAKEGELPAFLAGNPHFNPDTKQVFLALNYGRRPHGSAINYGYSYFVVSDELKAKSLYYAQDTFLRHGQGADAGAIQISYNNLGALLEANGDQHLRDAIFRSCYEGWILEDEISTLNKYYLVEAHHFGELTFAKHVECMVISPTTKDGTVSPSLWPTIVDNAKAFCKRNDVKLFQTD